MNTFTIRLDVKAQGKKTGVMISEKPEEVWFHWRKVTEGVFRTCILSSNVAFSLTSISLPSCYHPEMISLCDGITFCFTNDQESIKSRITDCDSFNKK